MVGRHEAKSLRQARLDTPPSTLSHGPTEGSRVLVPVYSGDRSTLLKFLKLFRTWILAHDAETALVTSEPIRVVGKKRVELDIAHGKERVNQSTFFSFFFFFFFHLTYSRWTSSLPSCLWSQRILSCSTIGEGGGSTIPSPGWSPK